MVMVSLVVSVIAVGLTVILLSIKILLNRGGQFPNTHVGGQKALRDKGITCHTSQWRRGAEHLSLSERLSSTKD